MEGAPDDFWGKAELDPDNREIRAWHPLPHHCADVAACFEAIVRAPAIRARLERLAGRDLDDIDLARLSVLAFYHDAGKACGGFQAKIFNDVSSDYFGGYQGHVREALALIAPGTDVPEPPLAAFIKTFLVDVLDKWFPGNEVAASYLLAVWSHHGSPIFVDAGDASSGYDGRIVAAWRPWRWAEPAAGLTALATECRRMFPLAFEASSSPLPSNPEFLSVFSGLVSVADWLGSDTRHFPYSQTRESRYEFARNVAARLVREIGFNPDHLRTAAVGAAGNGFAGAFGFPPRGIQSVLDEEGLASSDIVLIEAETGAGKTEAALYHFLRLFAAGRVDGLYFALPTRTSGVQIHHRVSERVASWLGSGAPGTVLAVPGYIRAGEAEGVPLPGHRVRWDDDKVEMSAWAAENAKRYTAAMSAVGTVDQVLISGLQARHALMRASCLMRSLLVIDEVHASDAYMTEIMRSVIRRHVRQGGAVLLMSATLGSTARTALLETPGESLAVASVAHYPCVWARSGDEVKMIPVERDGSGKSVHVSSAGIIDRPDEIAASAVRAARQGARVLVIRNSVAGAVDVFDRCRDAASELLFSAPSANGKRIPALHHGRYCPEDRRLLDKEVDAQFGKNTTVSGCILIGTQTLEQSLDIDADYLITDICPIDVLLQRIGRLHRHARTGRPSGFETPQCSVLTPEHGVLDAWVARPAHGVGVAASGSPRAYRDVRIVQRTLDLVASRPVWNIPADNRLLVEEGTHPDALSSVEVSRDEIWRRHSMAVVGSIRSEIMTAKSFLLDFRKSIFGAPADGRMLGGDVRVSTRLGTGSYTVDFGQEVTTPFGSVIDRMDVPAWMVNGEPDEVAVISKSENDFDFSIKGSRYRYKATGLARLN